MMGWRVVRCIMLVSVNMIISTIIGERGFVDFAGSKERFHKYQDNRLQLLIAKWGKEIVNDLYKINLANRLHVFERDDKISI